MVRDHKDHSHRDQPPASGEPEFPVESAATPDQTSAPEQLVATPQFTVFT